MSKIKRLTSYIRKATVLMVTTAVVTNIGYTEPKKTLNNEERCKTDAIRLCFFDIPNKLKITRCLIKKKQRLSDKCKPAFEGVTLDDYPLKGQTPKKNKLLNENVKKKEQFLINKKQNEEINKKKEEEIDEQLDHAFLKEIPNALVSFDF